MIISVPAMGGADFASSFSSTLGGIGLRFTGAGKLQGPSCQTERILSPTPTKDAANTIANTTTRVRILNSLMNCWRNGKG
jgi:hypothetical protein